MSHTATLPPPSSSQPPRSIDVAGTPRTPFARLVGLEFRKMVDTRAGFWLLFVTALLVAVAMAIALLVAALNDSPLTASAFVQIMIVPLGLLVPVLAITIVTSEWGQRTNLVTFALEPNRGRVVAAKVVTVLLLGLAAIALALVLGALGNVLAGVISGDEVVWNVGAAELGGNVLVMLLFFLMAFGFGCLLLNSPGAIAIYYVVALLLPLMVYGTLYAIFEWAKEVIPWIDLTFATAPLADGNADAMDWARIAVTSLVWVITPLLLGIARVLRIEIK